MATKLAAARIAAWSGVRAVIAAADAPGVVADAIAGRGVGTEVAAAPERLTSRKLWIAFAVGASGRVVVDDGARRALVSDGGRCSRPGCASVEGAFDAESAVEVVDEAGRVFAKGLVTMDAAAVRGRGGGGPRELPGGTPDRGHPPRRPRRAAGARRRRSRRRRRRGGVP